MKGVRSDALALVAVLAVAAALCSFAVARRSAVLEGDERDYLRAATHLSREGVFSHAPLADAAPAPDAFREPAYPALVAGAWWIGRCPPPTDEAAFAAALADSGCAVRAVRGLNLALLGASALAAAAGARLLGGGGLAALGVAALVAASPALRHSGMQLAPENLAATLVAWSSVLAAGSTARRRPGLRVAAALVAGFAPLARAPLLALPLVFAALELLPGDERDGIARRVRRACALLLLGLVPSLVWLGRNVAQTGHARLADTRAAFLIRAELDEQLAREGALAAALFWTPLESARELALRLSPDSTLERYAWRGEGNFFTRALTRYRTERAASGDALAADRRLTREALESFARRPLAHLRATLAVAWRGMFVERSPRWLVPFDVAFPLGLLLAGATLALLAGALRGADRAGVAFVLPAAALFAGHALLTENLPRFALPSLPIAWVAAVLFVARVRARRAQRRTDTRVPRALAGSRELAP